MWLWHYFGIRQKKCATAAAVQTKPDQNQQSDGIHPHATWSGVAVCARSCARVQPVVCAVGSSELFTSHAGSSGPFERTARRGLDGDEVALREEKFGEKEQSLLNCINNFHMILMVINFSVNQQTKNLKNNKVCLYVTTKTKFVKYLTNFVIFPNNFSSQLWLNQVSFNFKI